jgi:hypothetical protein
LAVFGTPYFFLAVGWLNGQTVAVAMVVVVLDFGTLAVFGTPYFFLAVGWLNVQTVAVAMVVVVLVFWNCGSIWNSVLLFVCWVAECANGGSCNSSSSTWNSVQQYCEQSQ